MPVHFEQTGGYPGFQLAHGSITPLRARHFPDFLPFHCRRIFGMHGVDSVEYGLLVADALPQLHPALFEHAGIAGKIGFETFKESV